MAICPISGKLVRDGSAPPHVAGTSGIAHTRWATHGEPSDTNAHPHADTSGRLAVVHNGIIENAAALRAGLEAEGVAFRSQTDTEVLAHLIARQPEASLAEAVRAVLAQVKGAYGLAVIDAGRPNAIVAARNGGPVVIGMGDDEMFVASDAAALTGHARAVAHLDDSEVAEVRGDGFTVLTLEGTQQVKAVQALGGLVEAYDKAGFAHFMRKEIAEQPEAVRRTLLGRLDRRFNTAHLGGIEMAARELLDIRRVKILGCGSAYYAGALGAQLIEQLARIPAQAEPASEFRYRNPVIEQDTLYVAVSQSGETFDTLAAIQEIKRNGGRVLGVINAVQHHRTGMRQGRLSARRAGGFGRLDQNLHVDSSGVRPIGPATGPGSRLVDGARRAAARGALSPTGPDRHDLRTRG
jgi:glutamine---fructose-6-phosphate transaminase (isomerizing)